MLDRQTDKTVMMLARLDKWTKGVRKGREEKLSELAKMKKEENGGKTGQFFRINK